VAKLMQYCKTTPYIYTCHASWQAYMLWVCETYPKDYPVCEWTGGDWLVRIVACGFLMVSGGCYGWCIGMRICQWVDAQMEAMHAYTDSEAYSGDDASTATVETLAYSGDGNDDAWSACGTEAGEE